MSDCDPNLFEKELADIRPARTPESLMRRLVEARPGRGQRHNSLRMLQPWSWALGLRWGAAATAALLMILIAVASYPPKRLPAHAQRQHLGKPNKPTLKADNIEIDQQLLASFDTVTQLPDGEPVRLRCRQWLDSVVLRDSKRGVVIERQAPRLEVVPIAFEIY